MAKFWDTKFGSTLKGVGKFALDTLKESAVPIVSQVAGMATGILGANWQKNVVNDRMSGAEREAFNLNAQEAQKARDWNLQMDNTKYQRQVTDMQNAGINPALAMNGGVSTQATSNVAAHASTSPTPMTSVMDLATSVANLKNLKAQRQSIDAKTRLDNANANAVEIENKYRDENQQLINQGIRNSNNISVAREKEIYKNIDEADSRIKKNIAEAKTEEEKQRNYEADTLLKKANARQVEALTPVLVKLKEAETLEKKGIAAQAFAQAAYQQGLIDEGYIKELARKAGYDADQAEQFALRVSGDNAKRGLTDTMSNGEEFYDGKFAKFLGTTLWQIADLFGSVLGISVGYQGNTHKSESTSTSNNTNTNTNSSQSVNWNMR